MHYCSELQYQTSVHDVTINEKNCIKLKVIKMRIKIRQLVYIGT